MSPLQRVLLDAASAIVAEASAGRSESAQAGARGLARQGTYVGWLDAAGEQWLAHIADGRVKGLISGPLAIALAADLDELGPRSEPGVLEVLAGQNAALTSSGSTFELPSPPEPGPTTVPDAVAPASETPAAPAAEQALAAFGAALASDIISEAVKEDEATSATTDPTPA